MKSFASYQTLLPACLLGLSLCAPALNAQTVLNWTGNGNSNNGGNWTDPLNWGGATPVGTNNATLVNVTAGTRTVTVNSGESVTAQRLTMTQTTSGTNILAIASGGTLTLTNDNSAYSWGAAATGGGTSRIDLGGTINLSGRTSTTGVTINNDLNFAAGSRIQNTTAQNTVAQLNFNGIVNVDAAGGVARIERSGGNAVTSPTFGATSTLNINSGTFQVFTTNQNANSVVLNMSTAGTTFVASGAELRLSVQSGGSGSAGVALSNSGSFTMAGKVTSDGRGSNVAATNTITNTGSWIISGTSAVIEKATNSNQNNPTFVNSTTGILRGSGTLNMLDYNHLQTPGTDLALTNNGKIQLGNGSSGSGLSSVGTLSLVDVAPILAGTSILEIDLGGTTAGSYDVLNITSGSLTLGGTLAISLVNGFAPNGFSLNIITGGSPISGSFSAITVNGVSNADYSFSYADGIGTLTMAVPEPSVTMLCLAGAGMAFFRRSRRAPLS